MRFLVIATALALAACGSRSADTPRADSAAVTAVKVVDTTIKTDTVMVAGDTAKMP